MPAPSPTRPEIPRAELVAQLRALGVEPGGVLLVHTSFRAVRPVDGGPAGLIAAIREADLRRDLFAMASDSFRGREAGTLDEWRASLWLAEQAHAAGLRPAGDDGTYFQLVPMRRVRVSAASRVELGGRALALWRDAQVLAPTDAAVDAPVVFLERVDSVSLAGVDLRGKAVAAVVQPPGVVREQVAHRVDVEAAGQHLGRLVTQQAAQGGVESCHHSTPMRRG